MDELLEFVFELFIEGSIELGTNKKISKWIRYPLLFITILLFLAVIGLIIFVGISCLEQSMLGGVILIICGILMLVGFIIKCRNIYLKIKSN